jgi:hypothetical protein
MCFIYIQFFFSFFPYVVSLLLCVARFLGGVRSCLAWDSSYDLTLMFCVCVGLWVRDVLFSYSSLLVW